MMVTSMTMPTATLMTMAAVEIEVAAPAEKLVAKAGGNYKAEQKGTDNIQLKRAVAMVTAAATEKATMMATVTAGGGGGKDDTTTAAMVMATMTVRVETTTTMAATAAD